MSEQQNTQQTQQHQSRQDHSRQDNSGASGVSHGSSTSSAGNLFRQEVFDARQQRLYGEISLAQPLSTYLCGLVLLLIVVLLATFLMSGSYTRKETVRGYLKPSNGIIKVYPDRIGIVEQVHVKPGQPVFAGDPLLTLRRQVDHESGQTTGELGIHHLKDQLELVTQALQQTETMFASRIQSTRQSLGQLEQRRDMLLQQQAQIREQVSLRESQLKKFSLLGEKHHVSDEVVAHHRERLLEAQQQAGRVELELLNAEEEETRLKQQLTWLPGEQLVQMARHEREQSELRARITELEGREQTVIRASTTGTVGVINISEGMFVDGRKPLLNIISEGSTLVAELLLPTRAAGFVKLQDKTRLRFDAFPYQRFGMVEGEVTAVDTVVLLAGEADLPLPISEPVYRLESTLTNQFVHAYGEDFPLRSGMQVEAEVLLEHQSLLRWLLDPIFQIKGKLG